MAQWQPTETGREARGLAFLKDETENWKRLTDVAALILKGALEGIS